MSHIEAGQPRIWAYTATMTEKELAERLHLLALNGAYRQLVVATENVLGVIGQESASLATPLIALSKTRRTDSVSKRSQPNCCVAFYV